MRWSTINSYTLHSPFLPISVIGKRRVVADDVHKSHYILAYSNTELSSVCGSYRSLQHRFAIDYIFCLPEIFAIKSRSCPISRRNFEVLGTRFFGKELQVSDPVSLDLESGRVSNMWRSLVTIGQATSEIGRRVNKRKNYKHQLQNIIAGSALYGS